MASVIRVGQSQFASNPIDEDSYDRIMSCLHILEQISTDYSIKSVFLHDTRAAFARIVEAEEVYLYLCNIIIFFFLHYIYDLKLLNRYLNLETHSS